MVFKVVRLKKERVSCYLPLSCFYLILQSKEHCMMRQKGDYDV